MIHLSASEDKSAFNASPAIQETGRVEVTLKIKSHISFYILSKKLLGFQVTWS